MALHPKFFEGQTPPPVPIESYENIEWYNEQIGRVWDGFEYKGTRITGDHYWLLNFFPMQRVKLNNRGIATEEFDFHYGYFSQEDDYFFKQVEEARQDKMDVMLFTGRGFGKTYNVISIGAKLYVLLDNAHLIISASIKDHADPTMAKMREGLNGLEKLHPTLAQKRLFDNEGAIQAGEKLTQEGREITTGSMNLIEKIVYDKKPGKTKGRRLNWQHFEEVGDWSGAASLVDCIAASEGTWYVGDIKKAQVFYTGTGGTVTSMQAKEIFLDPKAFNIYSVTQYKDRPHAFFFPAYLKYGGFWEKDGISDAAGAKARLEAKREDMKGNTVKYQKHCQEYPFTIEEMFMLTGTNKFNQRIIGKNITKIEALPKNEQPGERGFLHWKRKHGKIVGVEWEQRDDGDIWILEHPKINPETGRAFSHLYVAGYDGIDVGEKDTATGKGSQGAIAVKKRMYSINELNNAYVCYYMKRPEDIDELYETCLMISWYFNCQINIEYSKTGIVGYFKQRNQLGRFMKRPKLTLNDITSERENNTIGTTPTLKNFGYGEDFLAQHIKDYGDNLLYLPVLYQLRDFRMDQRTYFDLVMAKFMCELGDDELTDKMVVPKKKVEIYEEEGYYTDEYGNKRWGVIPKGDKNASEFNFKDNISMELNIN